MGFDEDLTERMEERVNSETERDKIGDLVKAIDEYISTLDEGEITWLVPENVQGLEEAKVFQHNLENLFGWRIEAIDELIVAKLTYTKSIDGRMIGKKIDALSVLKANVETNIMPGLSDKLLGEDRIRSLR